MSGHLYIDVDGWAETAEALTAAGVSYPDGSCAADLRWHIDRRALQLRKRGVLTPSHEQLMEGIPGRPALVRRWRRTDYYVRGLLRDVNGWWDSYRWGVLAPGATQLALPTGDRQPAANPRQKSASTPPAQPRQNAEKVADVASAPPESRQDSASEAPHARSRHPHPHPHRDAPLPAERGDDRPGAEWIADRAVEALQVDVDGGLVAGPYLAAWEAADGAHVRHWTAMLRPRKEGAQTLPPRIPGARFDVRRRDVAAGLALAAARWKAEVRPTHQPRPPEPEPPAEDPPPEPEPEPVERPPPRARDDCDEAAPEQPERAKRWANEARQRLQRRERRTG